MGFHGSECIVQGDVRADVPTLIERHGYRIETTTLVSAANLTPILADDDRPIIVVYFDKGWTHIADPGMTLATDEPLWTEFTRTKDKRAFGWLIETTSSSLGFWDYVGGELRRQMMAVDGEVTESGDRVAEEIDIAWNIASSEDLLGLLERLGAPFQGMEADVEYQVFAVADA